MYLSFTKSLCEKLIQNEFHITPLSYNGEILSQSTGLVSLIKTISPIFYMVSIVHAEKINLIKYNENTEQFLQQIQKKLESSYHCTHIICLHLIVYEQMTEEISFLLENDTLLLGNSIHHIFWAVNPATKKIMVSKNSPNKLIGIEAIISDAFYQEQTEIEHISLKDLEQKVNSQYQLKKKSELPICTYSLLAINIILWLMIEITHSSGYVIQTFANHSIAVLEFHQFYRLISSIFLHADLSHIAYNSLSLFIFGKKAEQYWGSSAFLFIYFFSGLFSSIASIFFTKGYSIGASGAIYGIIASICMLTYSTKRSVEGLNFITIFTIAVVGIGMGFTNIMNASVDNFGHIGGFLSGLCISLFLLHFRKSPSTK